MKNKKTAKKNIKVRDLKPKKDAKGGAGVINGGVTAHKATGGPVSATGGPGHAAGGPGHES